MAVEIEITADHAGQRLDRLVKAMAPHVGFGAQQKWFRTGQVRLHGQRVKGAERVESGDFRRLPPHAQREASQRSSSPSSAAASSVAPSPRFSFSPFRRAFPARSLRGREMLNADKQLLDGPWWLTKSVVRRVEPAGLSSPSTRPRCAR